MGGCSSCSTGKVGGCKNNGGCKTGGCNKMNVFDWFSTMDLPMDGIRFDVVEVRFKNGRKEFYRNKEGLDIVTGDAVVVEAHSGHHLGYVSLMGELVRLQMQKKKIDPESTDLRTIYRKASERDLQRFEEARKREEGTLYRTRTLIEQYKLAMKLSDVEYQADNTKATFFYSAEERVDFRELIKALAAEFKIRVEMKQISLRQEAGRLGGIGVCGRELCCSTWLSDFKNVTTAAARYQNLSLNPAKLSGQCGRLKCCLNYELDTYMEALNDIPQVEKPIKTAKGIARLQKTDIFRKKMWFAYENDESNWIMVDTNRVHALLQMVSKGELPPYLSEEETRDARQSRGNATAIVSGDLTRMDTKLDQKKKRKKKKKKKNRSSQNTPTGSTPPPTSGI
jgi:cell fate regulator YaaT (PSP1 superfamily)